MELNELIRRVVGQHWRLVVAGVLAGTAVAAVANGVGGAAYTASTRLVLDTQDPRSLGEATVIADTAKAIGTSPSQVGEAMREADVRGRDPGDVADRVSISPLGSSAVLELSVTDSDAKVAAALSNALAARIIRTRLISTGGDVDGALADVAERIEDLMRRIAIADSRLAELDVELGSTATEAAREALHARREAVLRSRETLVQQRETLQSQRSSLVSAAASRPRPGIISSATPPLEADSRGWPAAIVIGLLLGLVVGLGAAALFETMRPTLVGGDVLARELDAPFLGALSAGDGGDGGVRGLDTVARRLQLLARVGQIDTVELVAAGADFDLGQLAERLQSVADARAERVEPADERGRSEGGHASVVPMPPLSGAQGRPPSRGETADPRSPELRIRPLSIGGSPLGPGSPSALVLVAPTVLKRAELAYFYDLLQAVGLPLLGLITCRCPQLDGSRREPAPIAA